MQQYLELAQRVLDEGVMEGNRTDVRAIHTFGAQLRFDLSDNKLAAITTKKVHHPSIIHELIWMWHGMSNTQYLNDNGVTIWDEWAGEDGELGPVYGAQWRKWPVMKRAGLGNVKYTIDQLRNVIETLRTNPQDRGMMVSSWNVGELEDMALRPCHAFFQVYSMPNPTGKGKRQLKLQVYQRSVDVFLGLPFNLEFYSILAHLLAFFTDHEAVELIHTSGNVHIYENHIKQVKKQLSREPFEPTTRLRISDALKTISELSHEHLIIEGYESHAKITGQVAV